MSTPARDSASSDAGARFGQRRAVRHGEVRLPAALGVLFAALMHTLLPGTLLAGPRYALPILEIVLLVPLVAVNPVRLTRETRSSRIVDLLLTGVVIVTNLVDFGFLLRELTTAHIADGRQLLLAALQVWLTNMIAFALVFWALDRGGPVARLPSSEVPLRRSDFLFPQDDQATAQLALGVTGDATWMPIFVDYLYLSITNSTAFSPTDTLPLTSRAKMLMSLQALTAMVLSLLLVARAVNILR